MLRPFRSADAAAWYAYLTDPRVTEHTSWPPVTPELITSLVDEIMVDYAERKSLRWVLAHRDSDELVGSCGYTRWERGTAELAYDLAPACWGLGLMGAAVRAAVAWAFATGSCGRVEAFVMTSNERSIAVLERAGFQQERLLCNHRSARGVPRDFYLYSSGSPEPNR